ncbi:ABC transporter ATP-binding protein [Mesorhizobium sp. NZP2298]|uniref:ABC transporter ATP-binding protein n=1 Tax=Mesorhizobium sp. NZP2298 TaxID=2483403 RepID=UPI0015554668|nr:ABC transporter ATP-binding protein [Mesorhizobium sp. NZP2298]QKC95642.1 ABC transporter ATP-binding protein [Mesorhizobium sp. NZP2298]
MTPRPMLQLKGLKKSYRGKTALRNLDLTVNDNEIFALLGPTGAGKSSTLLASAGLIDLDAGRVDLAGRDVTDSDPGSRDIAIVFEGFNLLPVLDVKDNIAFALRSPAFRESEGEISLRVGRTAELLRISHLLDRDVDTLSGGERQRVAIARALVRRPVMFLLDEPLSALDLKLREGLRAELRQIHRQHRSTMLYATHDYHGAIAIADRIGIIDGGVIQQAGTIEDIYRLPANVVVGRLVGSPSMAFFEAGIEDGHVIVKGARQRIPIGEFGTVASGSGKVLLGVWPEDIEVGSADAAGASTGTIYAVDNRGFERAIQVDTSGGSFRKVVPLSMRFTQGDACSFRIPEGRGFLFDAAGGRRISQAEGSR